MPTDEQGQAVDLTTCDKEPIHIPGAVQPHGALLALRPDTLAVLQVSDNTGQHFGLAPEELLGQTAERLLGGRQTDRLRDGLRQGDLAALNPMPLTVEVGGQERSFFGAAHQTDGLVVLELEPASSPPERSSFSVFSSLVKGATARLLGADDLLHLCQIAVEEVRRLTGFDRVMVYRFDADWNGVVLAEEKRASMASYLDLHFPASDIPAQARELYRRNWLRFVVDSSYRPARLTPPANPLTGGPLDLSFSTLRSVSPIHLEYLRNMGVGASLSVSILKDGQLWGLIACHHETARLAPYETRAACEFLGQVLSSQLAARENAEQYAYAQRLRVVREDLIASMRAAFSSPRRRFTDGLLRPAERLLELTGATGAAVCDGDNVRLVGETPTMAQVSRLREWLRDSAPVDLWATADLPGQFPEASAYADRASGLLAIFMSPGSGDGVFWFRPEFMRTVTWAGDPRKPVSTGPEGIQRLHPRTSFAQWKETVRGTSLPWKDAEVDAARELRYAMTALALRGAAQEMASLNQELAQRNRDLDAFAYIASHDLKAPLRGITQLAGWIEEDLADALTDESRGLLQKLNGRVKRMEGIVEGVLQYSRVGRVVIKPETVDVGGLLAEIVDLIAPRSGVTIEIGPDMPTLVTERLRLQQVFQNLLTNAVKHNTRPEGHVWVSVRDAGEFYVFAVADDGPGIEPQYHARIFGIFQTLEARDTVENTGIGLAIIKKIVEAQGGRVTVESELGHGATFRFTWPKTPRVTPDGG